MYPFLLSLSPFYPVMVAESGPATSGESSNEEGVKCAFPSFNASVPTYASRINTFLLLRFHRVPYSHAYKSCAFFFLMPCSSSRPSGGAEDRVGPGGLTCEKESKQSDITSAFFFIHHAPASLWMPWVVYPLPLFPCGCC